MKVYLDNAASTPVFKEVVEAMLPWFTENYGNPSSIHSPGRTGKAQIEQARKVIAQGLNASLGEIFFTSGGTEASNAIIKGVVRDLGVKHIVTSPIEHHCVLHSVSAVCRDQSVSSTMVAISPDGRPDLNDLRDILKKSPERTLVSLMHANNELGCLLDLNTTSQICHEFGAYFHSDSVQTMAHLPINVQQIPVHFLTSSAHKYHGPKGVGFMYINEDISLHPYLDGGSQERNMRGGTENVAGITGLAKAWAMWTDQGLTWKAGIQKLKSYMWEQLQTIIPGVSLNGVEPGEHSLYTILSVSFPPHPKNELLLLLLDIAGIAASGGSACTSGAEASSHVLEGIGADPDRKTIRFSFSVQTNQEEIDFTLQTLKKIYVLE